MDQDQAATILYAHREMVATSCKGVGISHGNESLVLEWETWVFDKVKENASETSRISEVVPVVWASLGVKQIST
jgi:hypothetical protein